MRLIHEFWRYMESAYSGRAKEHADTHLPDSEIDPLPVDDPVSIALANSEGDDDAFSRADHVHASGLTTKGDILTVDTALARLPVGANGSVLTADSGETKGIKWGAAAAPAAATFVTMSLDGSLTNERVLTGTANQVIVTDGGANGNATLSTPQNIHTAAEPTFAGLTLGTEEFNVQATTPSQITTHQNNYNPGNGTFFRLSSSAAWTITGWAGGVNGRLLVLRNIGSFNITLRHQNISSTDINRFICPQAVDVALEPDESLTLIYDATTQRWQVWTATNHTLLGGHTDTTTGTIVRGDLVVVDSLTSWARFPIGAANTVLRTSGTDPAWAKLVLTTDVTGNLPIANGGTGSNAKTDAFDALSPLTTLGDIIYHNGSDNVRLAGNITTTRKFARQTGTGAASAAPTWDTLLLADIPSSAASKLFGRGDSGAGAGEEITVGSGLTMTGTTLEATGGGGGAPTNAQYVTLATDGTLSQERVLTGTANQITVTDGGAGSTVTLATPQNIHTGAEPTFAGLTLTTEEFNLNATTPAQITADQNDYNPGNGAFFLVSANAEWSITGLDGGVDGRVVFFRNTNVNTINLTHNSSSSAAENRFNCAGGVTLALARFGIAQFIYDATAQRWAVSVPVGPHALLSSVHTDTVASTVTTGDLIIGTSSGWDDLAIGSSGTVLKSNGTTASWQTAPLKGYIWDLTMSNALDATNDITVAAGEATDETGLEIMVLGSAITKQIDAAWAVGTNAGGMNTGSVANNTWYEVHLIKRSDTGVVDVMFTTTANRATLPASYTHQRRIGWVRRATDTNLAFTQVEDYFTLTTAINDAATIAVTTSETTQTLTVPPNTIARFRAAIVVNTTTVGNSGVLFAEVVETSTPDDLTGLLSLGNLDAAAAAGAIAGHFELRVNSSSQITYDSEATTGSPTFDISTFGWIDHRRRLAAI